MSQRKLGVIITPLLVYDTVGTKTFSVQFELRRLVYLPSVELSFFWKMRSFFYLIRTTLNIWDLNFFVFRVLFEIVVVSETSSC